LFNCKLKFKKTCKPAANSNCKQETAQAQTHATAIALAMRYKPERDSANAAVMKPQLVASPWNNTTTNTGTGTKIKPREPHLTTHSKSRTCIRSIRILSLFHRFTS